MIRRVYILLIAFCLTSCLTVKQIERNCDQFAKICLTETDVTEIHDTTWIEKRDTIVEYVLKRDTISNTVFLPSIERSISSDTSYLTTGLASSVAFIWRSQLFHTLESGDTILNIRLNDAITEQNRLRHELNKKVQTVTIREDTRFGKFCKRWFWGSLVAIFLCTIVALWKIFK